MSIRETVFSVTLIGVILATVAEPGYSQAIKVMTGGHTGPWPIDLELKILRLPQNAGPGELTLRMQPSRAYNDVCDEVLVKVQTESGLTILGAVEWTVPVDSSTMYSTVLNIDLADNDTSAILVHTHCDRFRRTAAIYFVTTGDTVETYGGHPRGRTPRPNSTWSEMERAKFTPEQLQKEFDFILDLRHCYKNCRAFVDSALGTLQPTDTANVYRVRTTIDNYIKLWGDWGITIIPTDYEALNAEYPPSPDDTPPRDSSETGDTLKSQSSLDKDPSLPYEGAITLERVTKLSSANTLPINETITYYIRLNNNTGTNMKGISNGFRVYSPDGADWSSAVGDTLGTLSWKGRFDLLHSVDHTKIV